LNKNKNRNAVCNEAVRTSLVTNVFRAERSMYTVQVSLLALNCLVYSLTANCTLRLAFRRLRIVTTRAISRTSMLFYLRRVRICMVFILMPKSTFWQRPQIICFVRCSRCNLETLAVDLAWELVEKTR